MNTKKPNWDRMQDMMLSQSQQATEALERDIQPHPTVERHDQRLNVLLTPTQKAQLKTASQMEGLGMSELVWTAIEQYIQSADYSNSDEFRRFYQRNLKNIRKR